VQSGQSSILKVLYAASLTYSSLRLIALLIRSTNSLTDEFMLLSNELCSFIWLFNSRTRFSLSYYWVFYTSVKRFKISRFREFATKPFVSSITFFVIAMSRPIYYEHIASNFSYSSLSSFSTFTRRKRPFSSSWVRWRRPST
jgi:hypothetical protein